MSLEVPSMPTGWAYRWAAAALLALGALGLAGLWWAPGAATSPPWWQVVALTQGLAWCAVAEVVRRSGVLRGTGAWTTSLLLATGTCLLAASLLLSAGLAVAAAALVWVGMAISLPAAVAVYPNGRPRTRGDWVTVAVLAVLGLAGLGVVGLGATQAVGGLVDGTGQLRLVLAGTQVAVLVPVLWWRGEHTEHDTRVALLWLALGAGGGGLLLGHLLFAAGSSSAPGPLVVVPGAAIALLVPASFAVGLVSPQVGDVRRLLSGLAVWVTMVDLTVGVVAGSLAALSWSTGSPTTKGGVAVVATACAVAFGPTYVRVRRIVEEILFGGSTDPLDAMSRLGAELGSDSSPDAWVEAVRSALVVQRVELTSGGVLLSAAGPVGGMTETTALRAGGEHVGDLIVTVPAEATRLPRGTRAVLELLAAPLARALQAVRLAEELHASRGRVVQAREEERRRLRRDLHDGLGPVLTGVAYTADAASNVLRSDADSAERLLAQLRVDTADAIGEIRRIVGGLRPPALDEVGLTGAVRQHAVRYAAVADVEVRCTLAAANSPGRLPAAVEVVAYRVVVEALTNSVRHARPRAGARTPRIVIGIGCLPAAPADPTGDRLLLSVQDDGEPAAAGSGPSWATGTGLASMAARCDEVGGVVVAGQTTDGGRVEAQLPLGGGRA